MSTRKTHKLFQGKMGRLFVSPRTQDSSCISSVNPEKGTRSAVATVHKGFAQALNVYAGVIAKQTSQTPALAKNASPSTPIYYGEDIRMTMVATGNGDYSSECVLLDDVCNPTGRYVIAKIAGNNNAIKAALYDPETHASSPLPAISDDSITELPLAGIFGLVLLKVLDQEKELQQLVVRYKNSQTPELMYQICDYCYYAVVTEIVKIKNLDGDQFGFIDGQTIEDGTLYGSIFCGPEPVCLCGIGEKKVKTNKTNLTLGEAKDMFSEWRQIHSDWTEFEQDLIPSFPDDIPVPTETLSIANKYVKSQGRKLPMVNFMWRGITGYGKSTGTEMLAALLNMPLVRITCHPQMERQEFLTNFVPDSSAKTPTLTPDELPTPMEIDLDPATAYRKMTGVDKPDATTDECNELYLSLLSDRGNTPRFKLVESEFIKGLQHGWIVEVQEVSRIRDSGVMVGLNEYDRPGARIPLVDGRFVRRHPEALVLYTDNVGYNSCRALDPSFLRRMACIYDSYDMPKDKVLERVVRNTDFDDPVLLDKMYNLWRKIADYCQDQDITEGSISICELEQWANAVMIDGPSSVLNNCMSCVVSKATSDVVEQNLIKSTVLAQADI